MFHSRELNNRINRLHKRASRLIYNDFTTSFEQLLDKDNSFTIHQKNIQSLTIEMYKVAHGLSTNLFSEIFTNNEATNHFRSKFFLYFYIWLLLFFIHIYILRILY